MSHIQKHLKVSFIVMILKKLIIALSFLLLLNGCAQSLAFLGPAITGASTGSAANAGLSYGSSKVMKKVTGKTPTERLANFFKKKDEEDKNNYNILK